jgi:hypothetical protein
MRVTESQTEEFSEEKTTQTADPAWLGISSRNAGLASCKLPPDANFMGKEREAVFVVAHFMDRQDVGMIEACGRLGFVAEARGAFRGNPRDNAARVYSNDTTGMALARAEDHTHPARSPPRGSPGS